MKVKVRQTQRSAFRPGTFANLKTQLHTYLMFCVKFKKQPFPTSDEVICPYICFLADNMKSTGSVKNYVAGIKTWNTLTGYDSKCFYSNQVKLTMSGAEKLNTHVPQSKLPIWPLHLHRMVKVLQVKEDTESIVLWSIISIAYFAMLRKSQFANNSVKAFNPAEQFTRDDFQFTEYGISVRLKWSKTEQKHISYRYVPITRMPQTVLCPVKAYSRMVSLVPALPDEPAFGIPHKGKVRPFSRKMIDNKFKALLSACELVSDKYSFHSLRHGSASLASASGCSDSDICCMGNWKSDCYKNYVHLPTEVLLRVTKKMAEFC